jgi:putative transposase
MRDWAAELVERARSEGVELTGDNGLLTALVRQVLQTGLEVEMTDHLGYEPHATEGRGSGNSRNGRYPKTVTTEVGKVELRVPRDRNSSFAPVTVRKGQRRLDGLTGSVISLYAKGMTTGDIQAHLAEIYGTEISRDTISRITDAVVEDLLSWQNRPLDRIYPVLLIDAIVVKIRDGQVANRPIYVAMGINLEGERDVLGLWVGPAGGEGAKFWMTLLTELRNRGVQDTFVVCCDGPKVSRMPSGPPGPKPRSSSASRTWCVRRCGTRPRSTGGGSVASCARSTPPPPSTRPRSASPSSPTPGGTATQR